MNIKRLLRHFTMTHWQMQRVFSSAILDAIAEQIKQCEATHGGEIRVAIEAELSTQALLKNQTARERAIEVFANLHVWDTAARNGVLIYLCVADRAIEIIADRGFEGKVSAQKWQEVCALLQHHCAEGNYRSAVGSAIQSVSSLIAEHFPQADRNELSDRPVLL